MKSAKLLALIVFLLPASYAWGQSGKISGQVTEAATGEPLPGVNVLVVGTQQGAITDADGYYDILNVSPGTYDVRASFVGFRPVTAEGVSVNIDLTSEVDFALEEEAAELDEVVVQATTPVVQRDISANVANLSAESIENMPVSSFEDVVGLQAGVEPGLSIRGSAMDEVNMMVDGLSMTDGRDNTPFTGISFTSIQEAQVQSGGFNAEYGNVRSGLINVVTREGPRDYYTADVLVRYAPPQKKHFGFLPDDPDAFWMRPYLDPDVAFEGTSAGWDPFTQRQYPEFDGWNAIADQLAGDDDPNNDLTPEQLQEVFLWEHRKDVAVHDPDYTVDASFGGPMPLISDPLGDLRFFASYRQSQAAYIVPQNRDAYQNRTGQIKLTSNLASQLKLVVTGMYNTEVGIHPTSLGGSEIYRGETPQYPWDTRVTLMAQMLGNDAIAPAGYFSGRGGLQIFGNDTRSLMDVERNRIGATLTHTLGANTFYEVRLQRMHSDYFTRPDRRRDMSPVHQVGSLELNESPFGWMEQSASTLYGMITGGEVSRARDTSWANTWAGGADITSQVNRYLQVKGGVDYVNTTHRSNHRELNVSYAYRPQPSFVWKRHPKQGAAYAQGKLEFEGMVANVGLRADYFDAGGMWYIHEPFDRAFSAVYGRDSLDVVLEQQPTDALFALSPRLGVSFPITTNSKFYFNYGHFRQMLNPNSIYVLREISSGAVDQVGNPEHPMPRTIAYELGFEQNLLNRLLLRVTGYYKDVAEQPRMVGFESIDGQVDYSKALPYNYSDTRGFEVSLRKNRGWYRGFVNYSYMVRKSGNFGFAQFSENPVEQRQYERESRAHYQERPVPEPYARANVEFLAPSDFGPEALGGHPLGGWRLSFLGDWRSGQIFTWTGGGGSIQGLENNVKWRDHYNLDLRLARNFETSMGEAQIFVDVSNVLNHRQIYQASAFLKNDDFQRYMQSLHLPDDTFEDIEGSQRPYDFIPGNDRPGDFRKPGTEFVPIEIVNDIGSVGNPMEVPLYYVKSGNGGGTYMWYRDGEFSEADDRFVDDVLENQQYIDMPNQRAFTFLNPRHISLGLRIML